MEIINTPSITRSVPSKPSRYETLLSVALVFLFASRIEALDVKHFGAAGDGVTDDTPAFFAALAEAAITGEEVAVPPGRYLVLQEIDISAAVTISGSGSEASVITSGYGPTRFYIHESGTTFRDLGFEEMIEPIALVSRQGYLLQNITIERCRFQRVHIRDRNRGVIGLSSGNASQQLYPLRSLVVTDCSFLDIDAHAINIRGKIEEARIIGNEFIGLVNSRNEKAPPSELGGYAIRLGTDETGESDELSGQGKHRIEQNTIRNLKKKTTAGNLMGILVYGNSTVIRNNTIENLDGKSFGDDTIAIYIRGGYNQIVFNQIREVRGSDDDGAISFKGASEINYGNTIAYNVIENIYGMSAVEVSSSALQFYGNFILNAPARGFMQRTGEGVLVANNTFWSADVDLRTEQGVAYILDNELINSRLWLSQRTTSPSARLATYIHENSFTASARSRAVPMIRLANNVQERFVSIRGNRFENASYEPVDRVIIDLVGNGTLQQVAIVENYVVQNGSETQVFRISSADELVLNNVVVFNQYPVERPIMPKDLRLIQKDSDVALIWTSVPNQSYRAQYSTDLEDWFDFGETIDGTGETIQVEELPQPWSEPAFYRLVIEDSSVQ